jgi:hypothetical protein
MVHAVLVMVVSQVGGWQIDSAALESWLGGAQKVAIVAPAGDEASVSAARAVQMACARSRHLHLVLGQGAISHPEGLEDAALGLKAAELRLEAAIVLRARGDGSQQLTLRVISPEGRTLQTVVLEPGRPLATNVDADAPVAAAAPVGEQLRWQGRSFAAGPGQLYMGADFYRVLGRGDLAGRYLQVQIIRGTLVGAGFAAVVAGVIAGYFGFTNGPCLAQATTYPYGCGQRDNSVGIAGVAVGVVGAAAMLVGAFLDPHPISDLEQVRLVSAHNAGLPPE